MSLKNRIHGIFTSSLIGSTGDTGDLPVGTGAYLKNQKGKKEEKKR